jgi:hypothetical protein
MNKWFWIIMLFLGLVGIIDWQYKRNQRLQMDCDDWKRTSYSFLEDVKHYQTRDSLNAASVQALELKLSDYKRYRSEEIQTIERMQTKNRELNQVIAFQTVTISELSGRFKDSVILAENRVDTLRCLDIYDKYFELHGCADSDGNFGGNIISRDSFLIAVTTKYKRFLGFLWRTGKVENRQVDLVSKKLNTRILGVEFVEIKK